MVQGGVEHGFGIGIPAFYLHLGQLLVPGAAGIGLHGFKIPARKLGGHVGLGAFHGYGGQGHLHHNLVSCSGVADFAAGVQLAPFEFHLGDGAVEGGPEEDLLVSGPAAGVAVAAEGNYVSAVVFHQLYVGVIDGVPASAVLQIQQDGGVFDLREGIAVHAHAGGGRHFGRNVVTLQGDTVVAGLGNFLGAVCIAPGAAFGILFRSAGGRGGANHGHHGDVKQVSDAGAGKVRVAEADDRVVRVVVAGAPVPLLRDAGGAQLHKAEGHVGPYEHVAVAAGSNLGVDEGGIVVRGHRGAAGSHYGRRGCKK